MTDIITKASVTFDEVYALSNFYLNLYSIPFLFASIFILFLGSYIFIFAGDPKKKWAFLGFTLAFFFWLFGTFLTYSSREPQSVLVSLSMTYLGVSLISPTLYNYVCVWLGYDKKNKGLIYLGFLIATLLWLTITFSDLIFFAARKYYWGYHSQLTVAGGAVFLTFFIGYMLLFFQVLIKAYRAEEERIRKKQILLVAISFGIAYLGSSDFMPCYGREIFPTGGLMTVVATASLAYTIVRYKLLDIETMIHRTLFWVVSTVVAILPFVLVLYVGQDFFIRQSPSVRTSLLLVILILFSYYFHIVQPKIGEMLRLKSANLNRTMIAFSRRLTHLNDLRTLLQRLTRTIQKTILANGVAVFLVDEESQMMVPAMAKRIRGLEPISLETPFLTWIEKKNCVVVTRLVISDPEILPFKESFISYLDGMGAEVVIPFVHGGKLIGIAYLDKKESLKRYRSLDVKFLSDLRVPVSIALSNSMRLEDVSKLYKELQLLNEELEQRVEDRTKELIETQGQLIQAEKLATIGTMAGGVAHEINNPLTAVLTNAQILKMTANDDDIELIDMIEEGAKRCQEITKNLLNYARKENETEVFSKVNLYEVILGISNFLKYQLEQKGLTLSINSFSKEVFINGVKSELEQVLTNFILNSRDAIIAANREDGKIKIDLQEEDGKITLSVEDNGIGIEEKNLNKIFDPFFTTKDVGAGTGLGLSVSHGIMQKHNIHIEVASVLNKGTRFKLTF
jgi:signal transduction histidine kinase